MTIVHIKPFIALVVLAAALVAALAKLKLLGTPAGATNPERLNRRHRLAGIVFGSALAANAAFGAVLLSRAGDQLSERLVLHWHIALGLLILFLIKLAIVKKFRVLLRWAPAVGMTLFALSAILVIAAAGFAFLAR
jgi:hypothetical protein